MHIAYTAKPLEGRMSLPATILSGTHGSAIQRCQSTIRRVSAAQWHLCSNNAVDCRMPIAKDMASLTTSAGFFFRPRY